MDADLAREFFRKYQNAIEDLWLEKQCCRTLILDKGLMTENELDQVLEDAKRDLENRKIAAETFATSRRALAEFGMKWMLDNLPTKPPASDKQN